MSEQDDVIDSPQLEVDAGLSDVDDCVIDEEDDCHSSDSAEQEHHEQPSPPEVIAANTYCDVTGEMFCHYYLRCGRIHAASLDECLKIFDETCKAVYEPRYIALEQAGGLELSNSGIQACTAHLESLACETQIFDLDGPCALVWRGLAGPGGSCGAGMESFVCQTGTACVIDMSLCGTCQPTVQPGQPCGEGSGRCEQTSTCVQGYCVERARPGEACGENRPCALGASCENGECARFNVVKVGQECDQNHRCPYNAVCVESECQPQAGLGEACTQPGQCRSGYCDVEQGKCLPFRIAGEGCYTGQECLSGRCREHKCTEVLSSCFH